MIVVNDDSENLVKLIVESDNSGLLRLSNDIGGEPQQLFKKVLFHKVKDWFLLILLKEVFREHTNDSIESIPFIYHGWAYVLLTS